MAARPARPAGRQPTSGSSPAPRWPTSPASPPAAAPCSRRRGWDVRRRRAVRRAAGQGAGRRGAARHGRSRAAVPRARPPDTRSPADDQGRIRLDALADALDAVPAGEPVIVVPAGGQPPLRRLRPVRRGGRSSPHRRGAWVHVDGAFGLWAAATPRLAPLVDGLDARRLVGHRRPQDAQRRRTTAASRSSPTRPRCASAFGVQASYLADDGSATRRPLREGARAVAAGPRRAGVGGAASLGRGRSRRAGRRSRRPRRATSPPGWPRSTAPRCSTTSYYTQVCVSLRRRRAHPRGHRAAARRRRRPGCPGHAGAAATCCASRSATGRPTPTTCAARSTPCAARWPADGTADARSPTHGTVLPIRDFGPWVATAGVPNVMSTRGGQHRPPDSTRSTAMTSDTVTKNIVVGIDGSNASIAALRYAIREGLARHARRRGGACLARAHRQGRRVRLPARAAARLDLHAAERGVGGPARIRRGSRDHREQRARPGHPRAAGEVPTGAASRARRSSRRPPRRARR